MSKNKLFNIFLIDKLLSEGQTLSIDNIQKHINSSKKIDVKGISERNLEYYIQQMRNGDFGKKAPIEYDNIQKGYRYTKPGFSLFYKDFTEQQKILLQKAINVLNGMQNQIPQNQDLVGGLSLLLNRSSDEYEKSVIEYETAYLSVPAIFDELYHHIIDKNVLRIEYINFKKQENTFNVTPFLLKEFRNRWYLIGYDNGNDRIVNLGLERIQNVSINKNIIYRPCTIDLKEYYSHSIGMTITDHPIEEVIIKVNENISPYILTKPIHSSQQLIEENENTSVFSYNIRINVEFQAELLRYGSAIEILSPLWFREKVKNDLIKSLAKYSN